MDLNNVFTRQYESALQVTRQYLEYSVPHMKAYWGDILIDFRDIEAMRFKHERRVFMVRETGTTMTVSDCADEGGMLPDSDEVRAQRGFAMLEEYGVAALYAVVIVSFEDGSYELTIFDPIR